MSPGTRLVWRSLRALRVVVACLFLGLAALQAPSPSVTDAVAWITGAGQARPSVVAARDDARRNRREVPGRESATAVYAPDRVRPPSPPARARALVVQRRLYLRNAALLS